MAIDESIWRFQCDPAGNPNPMVQIFTKEVTIVDGETFEKLNMTPALLPFSEFAAAAFNATMILDKIHALPAPAMPGPQTVKPKVA